jgi:thiol:disulfide interchange protein DsbD
MIDFTGHACVNCRKMETVVWSHPNVLTRLRQDYVLIQLYVDDRTPLPEQEQTTSAFNNKPIVTLGNKWSDLQASAFNTNAQPYYVLLDSYGQQLGPATGAQYDINDFETFLDEGLRAFRGKQKNIL